MWRYENTSMIVKLDIDDVRNHDRLVRRIIKVYRAKYLSNPSEDNLARLVHAWYCRYRLHEPSDILLVTQVVSK